MTTDAGLLAYQLIPLFSAALIPFAARKKLRRAEIPANVTLLAGLLNIGMVLAILGAVFHLFNQAVFGASLFLDSACLEKGAGAGIPGRLPRDAAGDGHSGHSRLVLRPAFLRIA